MQALNPISHGPELGVGKVLGIRQLPVESMPRGERRAGVTATHGHDVVPSHLGQIVQTQAWVRFFRVRRWRVDRVGMGTFEAGSAQSSVSGMALISRSRLRSATTAGS